MQQVYRHMEAKRVAWNRKHPHSPMTWTNTAIDHIRPVKAFQGGCVDEKMRLCNHLRNLQPLLLQDNAWKGSVWQDADEAHWRKHIIACQEYPDIYYPQARQPLSLLSSDPTIPIFPQHQSPSASTAASLR